MVTEKVTSFFLDVTLCSMVEIYERFGVICCSHPQGINVDSEYVDVGKFLSEYTASRLFVLIHKLTSM